MKSSLSSNIRTLRKEKGLTQEQLADVFSVTTGAVHKWEAGLSTPELSIMMEMADFFDVSLDMLVGFDVRDNRIEAVTARLRGLVNNMDQEALSEAEKALKKYPNSFRIVSECANIYRAFSARFEIDKELCSRARELYEQAIRLISQNSDPNIDATVLYGHLASIYQMTGDLKTSLELYKAHNAGYIYNLQIGQILVQMGRYEEAEIYLSYDFIRQIGDRVNLIISKALNYIRIGRLEEARDILNMGLIENSYLRKSDAPMFLDKIDCLYLTGLACVELKTGSKKKAADHLKQARKKALRFDAAPDYDTGNEKFIELSDACMAYDTTGKTGIEGIVNAIDILDSGDLKELWENISADN